MEEHKHDFMEEHQHDKLEHNKPNTTTIIVNSKHLTKQGSLKIFM